MTGKSETAVPLADLMPEGKFLRLLHNSATAWAILLCSLLITAVGWYISNKFVQQRAVDRFQFETTDIQLAIRNRMLNYEQVLRGGVGLHAASESIARQQWNAYVKKLKINEQFPGIQGLGVSVLIRPEEKAAHIQRMRAEGFPTYTIRPETERAEYHSIIYLEPFEGRNLRAFGYDMSSEPVRRAAMEQARDSGQPTISGIVTLVQETDQDVQHGFLMFWPVYRNGQPQATPAERRRAFIGLVYSPFRMKDLMRGILGGAPPEIDFEIFDSEQMSPQTLLHDSDERLHLTDAQHHPDFARTTTIKIGARVWTLYFNARPSFLSPADSNQPLLIGLGGLLVDLLLFYIIGSTASLKKRAVALAAQMTGEFRAKNAELEAVMQSFPDLYFWLGADGTIQQYHANRLSDLYLPPEQFIGKTMQEVLPPPLGERFAATQAQALSSGTVVGIEYALAVADGAKEFEARFAPLQENRVLAVVRDITTRQLTAAQLRESEERFRLMADTAPVLIWMSNADNRCSFVNQGFLDFTGRTLEQELGDGWTTDMHPDDLADCHAFIANLCEMGQSFELEHRFKRFDGEYRWLLNRAVPRFLPDGSFVGFIGSCLDITERKQMEAELKKARDVALESARLKAEFLANMSHEIRTPMGGIIGMTDLLMDTELSAEQQDYAQTIQGSADALLSIINDILDFSKIEAGKLQLETINFNLRTTVESAIELLAEQALDKKLELALLFEPDVPELLRGDPGRVRQVLMNLIGNAIKFTAQGEVTVHLTKESESETEVQLRAAVTDTGIGITPEALPRLFQAFTQADGSMTRRFGGTGLGLAISKQLVELLGGEIEVASTFGRGSTFSFTLRLEKQARVTDSSELPTANLRGLRVLIVDDNAINRRILVTQTAAWEMQPQAVSSGWQALDLLREAARQGSPYDLALLDLHLPDMAGFELARAIKADASLASTHLILLSPLSRRGQRGQGEMAREAGIAAYLPKPIRCTQLYDCLARVMAGRTPEILVTRHTLQEARAALTPPPSQRAGSILIAEDNEVNQKVLRRQMEELGYHAEVVSTGREAVAAFTQKHYDLVLMDCQMPELDGYAATAEIRQREGQRRHTPVIALTAHAMQGDREKCLAAGMDDYLTKPVRIHDLGKMLAHWCQLSALTQPRTSLPVAELNQASSPEPDEVPVDMELLLEVGGGNGPGVQELVDFYLLKAAAGIEKLKQSLAEGDFQSLERAAHSLKGASATCGMRAVVPPLLVLEELSRAGQGDEIAQMLCHIEREFDRIKLFLGA